MTPHPLELVSDNARRLQILVAAVVLVGCANTRTAVMTTAPASTPPTLPTAPQPLPASTTFNHGDYTFSYPSAYYVASNDPVILVADTKATYDMWMQEGTVGKSGLLIQLASLSLDRRLDPNVASGSLATVDQALHREINRTVGVSYEVSGSTDVPWENADGETYDGRKVFYPSIPYEDMTLGTARAAKASGDEAVFFFILVPGHDTYYVRITIQPPDSILMTVADRILSTFTFTH
jgi:hypothetical protein